MAVKKWATTNGTVWSFNGSIVTSLVDSENPQGIPPSTIRLKFSDPNYNPSNHTFYVLSDPANISWRQVSSEPNVWDGYYPPYRSGAYTSWQSMFQSKFNDHTNIVEVVGANLEGVYRATQLFDSCSSLLSVSSFDFGSAIECQGMFKNCTNLRTVGDIAIHGDDLYDGTTHAGFPSVYQMFEKCSSLTTIGNVTLDHIISLENLFYDCTSLTSIGTLYAPEAVNLHSTFCNCTSLAICPPMTISTTASNFNSTFYHCGALTACPIIPTFLNNATNCGAMFAYCRSLTAFPEFDMSHVTSMSSMFISCESITGSIPVYDLRNVDNCGSAFNGCKNVSGGILDTYNRFMSYTIQPTEHRMCFSVCGSNTQTGSAELAQIPSDWK